MKYTFQKTLLITICFILANLLVIIKPISTRYELDLLCMKYTIINNLKNDKDNSKEKETILKSIRKHVDKNLDLKNQNINLCREINDKI